MSISGSVRLTYIIEDPHNGENTTATFVPDVRYTAHQSHSFPVASSVLLFPLDFEKLSLLF